MSGEVQALATTTTLLEGGAIMLGTALVFVTLFRKLGLGATLGYIVGGILIGPHLLGLVGDPEQLASISEIGIALHAISLRCTTCIFKPRDSRIVPHHTAAVRLIGV